MVSNEILKAAAQQFANTHKLDEAAVRLALGGVLSRVERAMKNGAEFSDELVQAAFVHWNEAQAQYYADLIKNENGEKDKLMLEVYNELSGAH